MYICKSIDAETSDISEISTFPLMIVGVCIGVLLLVSVTAILLCLVQLRKKRSNITKKL